MPSKISFPNASPSAGTAPVVSIVMPSFNQAQFIEEAIESVLEQSYPGLELVVMDGGSTDGTLQVLERMSRKAGGRLRWVSEADRGAAHAINKAFALARGAIIGWLNSDDLYAIKAVERAVSYLEKHPLALMVYGVGYHIDAYGRKCGVYPSLRPPVSISDFRESCFICQPTIFLRRQVIDDIGGLDEQLSTAFDFDLWLRLFKVFPTRIGFINAVQAYSRLHGECKTMRMRHLVAMESMQTTARALGSASPNWFYTYLDEFFVDFPHVSEPVDVKPFLYNAAVSARRLLSAEDRPAFDARMLSDARLKLVTSDAYVNVFPDGWVGRSATLRIRALATKWRNLLLRCRHASPIDGKLEGLIFGPDGCTTTFSVENNGPFEIRIDLPSEYSLPSYWSYLITVNQVFIPANVEPKSHDMRELAFLIEEVRLED